MTEIINPYKKVCKFKGCQKTFIAKRLNQDYDTGDCKKKANNGKAVALRLLTKNIDDAIKLNRKILEGLHVYGKTVVELNELVMKGFDYSKHTGRCQDKNGQYTILQYHNYTLESMSNNKYQINKLW